MSLEPAACHTAILMSLQAETTRDTQPALHSAAPESSPTATCARDAELVSATLQAAARLI